MRDVKLEEIERVFGVDLPNEVTDLGTIHVTATKTPMTSTVSVKTPKVGAPQLNVDVGIGSAEAPALVTYTTVTKKYVGLPPGEQAPPTTAYYTPYAGGPRTNLK